MGEPPGVGTKTSNSREPVPRHPLLAEALRGWERETAYSRPDWVFPSIKLKGKRPRVANMLVSDHLRPAAVKAGVLAEGDPVRFGFHNLRHSLASFLVRTKTDIKTVQPLLRHANVTTTLGLYAHSIDETKLAAQGDVLAAILQTPISGAVN
jgi:integrase